MCRQAEVRRHDGLRAEGRSPYVGLHDSLRTGEKKCGAEKKIGGRKNNLGAVFFWGGVEKIIWPPNTITRRRRKKKRKSRGFSAWAPKNKTLARLRSKGLKRLLCI